MKKMTMKLTVEGIFKYGAILSVVEISTLASIYIFKLMIDFLKEPRAFSYQYQIALFTGFCFTRLVTIFARSAYDLKVYNYFRFVQT